MPDETHAPVSRAAAILWPIAALTVAHQLRDTYVSGPGGDLLPVLRAAHAFLDGGKPYDVDAFVYPPGALVLFAPLGLVSVHAGRLLFHVVSSFAIGASVWLLLRHAHIRLGSTVAPAVVFAVFVSQPVRSTLGLGNVNGLVLLAEVATLVLLREGRQTAAGVAFGLGLVIKPVLAPVVILFLLERRFRLVAVAASVVAALCLVGAAFTHDVSAFVRDVVPFLLRGNYAANYLINTSVRGAVRILELPEALSSPARVVVSLGVAVVLVRHHRRTPDGDQRLVEEMGILLAGTFLVFAFSWQYYCIYLLPIFVIVMLDREADTWRLALLGASLYLVGSPDLLTRLGSVRVTVGLLVFVAAFALEPSTATSRRRGQAERRRWASDPRPLPGPGAGPPDPPTASR